MGIMVYSLLWVMQDLDHQPYQSTLLFFSSAALPLQLGAHRVDRPVPYVCFWVALGFRVLCSFVRGFIVFQNGGEPGGRA